MTVLETVSFLWLFGRAVITLNLWRHAWTMRPDILSLGLSVTRHFLEKVMRKQPNRLSTTLFLFILISSSNYFCLSLSMEATFIFKIYVCSADGSLIILNLLYWKKRKLRENNFPLLLSIKECSSPLWGDNSYLGERNISALSFLSYRSIFVCSVHHVKSIDFH